MIDGRIFHAAICPENNHNTDIVGTAFIFNFLYQIRFTVSKYAALFREARREVEITYPGCHYHFNICQVLKIRVCAFKGNGIISHNARCISRYDAFHFVFNGFGFPVLYILHGARPLNRKGAV